MYSDAFEYIDDPYRVDDDDVIVYAGGNPRQDVLQRVNELERRLPEIEVGELIYRPWTAADFKNDHYVRVNRTLSDAEKSPLSHRDIHRYTNTVNDLRMGTVGREACTTCMRSAVNCVGHMGYIELARSIIHPMYLRTVVQILRCVQLDNPPPGGGKSKRGQLLIEDIEFEQNYSHLEGVQRLNKLESQCKLRITKGNVYSPRTNLKIIQTPASDHNGMVRYKEGNTEYELAVEAPFGRPDDGVNIRAIFESITPATAVKLGLAPGVHPRDFIIKHIPVIPNTSRPPAYIRGVQTRHDFTNIYNKIVELDNNIRTPGMLAPKDINAAQEQIFTLYHNIIYAKKDSANKQNSVAGDLKGKRGKIRANLEASRVNFGARTVITPNSALAFDEVSIPQSLRHKLTRTLIVTEENIEQMQQHMERGEITHVFRAGGTVPINAPNYPRLQLEDKVYRWLQVGEYVLINRNPSIHKTSFLAMRATFNPGKTVQINLMTAVPLNADFDGDEINIHVIQSERGYLEAKELVCVRKHIIDTQSNRPLTGLSYDYPVAAYLLTSPGTYVPWKLWMSCISEVQENAALLTLEERLKRRGMGPVLLDEDNEPIPLREGERVINRDRIGYPGKALFSALLPADFAYRKGDVEVREGILVGGVIGKKDIGNTANNIIQELYRIYGEDSAVDFLDNAVRLLGRWFDSAGFSIGVDDCVVMSESERSSLVHTQMEEIDKAIQALGVPPKSPAELHLYENRVTEIIGGADRAWESTLKRIIAENKNMMEMARISGAKGSELNITNISLMLGQQRLYGKRFEPTLTQHTRCLPYFTTDDISAASRGYCDSSFSKGLGLSEFVMHAAVSREGLLDTSANTADTGSMNRRLGKMMQNIMVRRDGTLRNAAGQIVQFIYGYDGFSPRDIQPLRSQGRRVNFPVNYQAMAEMLNTKHERETGL